MIKKRVTRGCALAACLVISACEATDAPPTSSDPGKNQAVFNTLFDHFDYQLPAEQNCSTEGPATIREFTADSLAYLSEQPSGKGRIEVNCETVQTDSSLANFYAMDMFPEGTDEKIHAMDGYDSLMQCQVSFSVSDEEVVWSRALQFLWNSETEKAIENTFRCALIP
ncbi:hypothetical protein [Marinimicrobium sp. C2-29]|uniref:hypothetical protein n=1 Tax=Marinimicrobium sp. C2-29 TaxID=3139825 RepID=UPI0031399BE3